MTEALLVVGWIALGALGVWMANRRLNSRYPTLVNRREDAWMYLMAVGGLGTFLGCLFYIATTKPTTSFHD